MENDDARNIACRKGNFQLVKRLADRLSVEDPGFFYLCIENSYDEPMDMIQKRIEICKLLLSRRKDLLNDDIIADWDGYLHEGPLQASRVHLEIIKFLINEGANVENVYGRETIVHNVAWYMNGKDFHELCCYLINDRQAEHLFHVNPEKWNDPLVHMIVYGKQILAETWNMLVKLPGVQKSQEEFGKRNILALALREKKDKTVIENLIESGKRFLVVSEFEKTHSALLEAAKSGDYKFVKSEISRGADITATTNFERNFLHLAAWSMTEYNYRQCTELVWNHKDIHKVLNTKSTEGRAILHERVRTFKMTSVELVKRLLEKTDDIHIKDIWGNTVFLSAVRGCKGKDVLTALVQHGANFADVNDDNQNALHLASLCGNIEAVKYLFNLGIEKNAKDDIGATALTYARLTLKRYEEESKLAYRVKDATNVVKSLEDAGVEDVVVDESLLPDMKTWLS